MVELQSVSWEIGGKSILHETTTSFRRHRFNVILGPNGAGKSTLLRIASGGLKATTGEVSYDGARLEVMADDQLALKRAVLSQNLEMVFPLPVEEIVLMGRYPHFGRVPTRRDRVIVDEALDLVGMSDRREQLYPTLSGGERQKVQLARVLAQIWQGDESVDERVLFLDEPTSNLDIHYQIHLLDVAKELLKRRVTVIAILHDINTAIQYGDAFFVLNDGRLVLETDDASELTSELLGRVFKVNPRRVTDASNGEGYWRFGL